MILRIQEFDNVLDLVQQKGYYAYEYFSDFKQCKELPRKEKFYSSLTDENMSDKNMNLFLMFGINLK